MGYEKNLINSQDSNEETPMHLAIYMATPEIVLKLAKMGGFINIKNKAGQLPFDLIKNPSQAIKLQSLENYELNEDFMAEYNKMKARILITPRQQQEEEFDQINAFIIPKQQSTSNNVTDIRDNWKKASDYVQENEESEKFPLDQKDKAFIKKGNLQKV